MNDVVGKSLADLDFSKVFANKYMEVFTNQSSETIGCVILVDYVPIRNFIDTLNQISELVRKGDFKRFVFDKRALRTFHQPSMEWYFVEWKTEMLRHGLVYHRKILPDLAWFMKAVEIAREPLFQKMDPTAVQQLDIKYCADLEEATIL